MHVFFIVYITLAANLFYGRNILLCWALYSHTDTSPSPQFYSSYRQGKERIEEKNLHSVLHRGNGDVK